jgi:hypothetical protein
MKLTIWWSLWIMLTALLSACGGGETRSAAVLGGDPNQKAVSAMQDKQPARATQ